jgi:hypothetical protein
MSALAFFASFLGRGFQDFNADDFVGELTTSTIFLSTSTAKSQIVECKKMSRGRGALQFGVFFPQSPVLSPE